MSSGGKGNPKTNTNTQSSTTNTQQTVNDVDNRVFGDDAIVVEGSSNSITMTDHGAIDSALDFGTESLREAFGFGGDALNESFGFGRDALDANERVTDRAFDFGGDALQLQYDATDRALDFGSESIDTIERAFKEILGSNREVSERANDSTNRALSTLGAAITTVGDQSRSDTTDAFRRIMLYVSIAAALGVVAYAYSRR